MVPTVVVPVVVVVMGVASYFKRGKDYGVMTPDRQKMYRMALNGVPKNPAELDAIALQFERCGLSEQGKTLRKRANLRRLPPEMLAQRRAVFRRAMKSKNRSAILEVALAFETECCYSTAARLREYASGLPDVVPEAVITPPEPEEEDTDQQQDPDDGGVMDTTAEPLEETPESNSDSPVTLSELSDITQPPTESL